MKIAMVTPVFFPYRAGIGNVAENEANELAKNGEDVFVFTPRFNQSEMEEKKDGYQIFRLRPFFKFGNAAWINNFSGVEERDIIHLHYPFIGGVGAVLRLAKKCRKPLVVTYHMDLIGRGWQKIFFKIYTFFTLPKIVKTAQKIIVSSWDYAEHGLLKKYVKKNRDKFVGIPFGIDLSKSAIDISKEGAREKLDIDKDLKIALFVGAMDKAHYFKGVNLLLEAFKEVNKEIGKTRLFLVGAGDLLPYYQRQANNSGLSKMVKFVGRASEKDLFLYYKAADFLVLPSIDSSEAFGLVVIEAGAAGLPAVVADLPGVRKQVSPERGKIFRAYDRESLVLAMKEMFQSNGLALMSETVSRWVKENRSLTKETKEILSVYKSVVALLKIS